MSLHKYLKLKGVKSKSKRIGRGIGSGKGGHTVGRGAKGQKARNKVPQGFEGGQVPLYKRIPEWGGFKNPTRKDIVGITLDRLNKFKAGTEVTPEKLIEKKIIKKLPKGGVKILATGNIEKKLDLRGFLYSKGAKKKLEDSGSTIA